MDFEKLIASLEAGNVDEAKTIAGQLKPQFETTVSELKAFEGKFNEAKDGRDKVKARFRELSEALGLNPDDASADKVKDLLKQGKNDETLKAEIANMQKLISDKETEFNTKLSESENRFKNKLIEMEIAKIGASSDVVNEKALSILIDAVKSGATLEDGEIVYKDEKGATLRNPAGRPLSIAERMAAFKSDTNNSFLFKPTSNGGGGTHNSGGSSGSKKRSEMSHAEKGKFIQEHGEEAYLKLPK